MKPFGLTSDCRTVQNVKNVTTATSASLLTTTIVRWNVRIRYWCTGRINCGAYFAMYLYRNAAKTFLSTDSLSTFLIRKYDQSDWRQPSDWLKASIRQSACPKTFNPSIRRPPTRIDGLMNTLDRSGNLKGVFCGYYGDRFIKLT